MLESIFTLWGLKMAFYIVILASLAWKLHQETVRAGDAEKSLAFYKTAYSQLQVNLSEQERQIRNFKAAAAGAEWRAKSAAEEADSLRRRLARAVDEIERVTPPKDPEGAIKWLAQMGPTLGPK